MFTIIFLTTAEGSTCKCKQALLPENTNLSRCHPTSLCPSLPGGCPGAGHGTCARALLHTVLLTPKSLGFSLPWFSPPLSCCRILLFWSLKKKKKNLRILRANIFLSAGVHYSHISGISLPWHDFCCISREPFPLPLTFSL